jgi:hypothetical protein
LLKGEKLTMNAAGLLGGARNIKDGVSFFGKNLKLGDKIINDFELEAINGCGGLFAFIIFYKKSKKKISY